MIKGANKAFAPLEHNHDDRYYTEDETNKKFALLNHNHDDRYYTETEIDKMAEDLKEYVVDGKEKIANAINDKTNDNQMNKDNTFDELAESIKNINTSTDYYDPITFMNYSIIRYLLNVPKDVVKNVYIFENNNIGIDGKCQLFTTWGGTSTTPGAPIYDKNKTRLVLGDIKRGQYLVGLKWNTIDNFGDDAVFDIDGAEYQFTSLKLDTDFGFTPVALPSGATDWQSWLSSTLNPSISGPSSEFGQLYNINVAHKNQTPKIINKVSLFIQEASSSGKLRFRGQCEGFFYFLIPTKLKG